MPSDPELQAEVARLLGIGLITDAPTEAAPKLISAVGLARPEVRWLWEGYLQDMKLTNIEARGSGGKSRLALGIAACASIGVFPFSYHMEPWRCEPFSTIVFSSEDEPDEIAATFEECGGDRRKLFIYSPQEHGPLTLDEEGIERLRDIILEVKPKILLFDPILEFAPDSVKHQSDNTGITQFLASMRRLGVREQLAPINIRHWAKGIMGKEMHELAAGGEAWRNGARGQLVIFGHIDNDSGIGAVRKEVSRFLVCSARNSQRVQYGGPFEIVVKTGEQSFVRPDMVDIAPYANCYQAVRTRYNLSVSESGEFSGSGRRGPAANGQAKAAEAITAYLKEHGPTHYRKFIDAMKSRIDAGEFSKATLYRARQILMADQTITDVDGTWGLALDNATLDGYDPFASPDDPDDWDSFTN